MKISHIMETLMIIVHALASLALWLIVGGIVLLIAVAWVETARAQETNWQLLYTDSSEAAQDMRPFIDVTWADDTPPAIDAPLNFEAEATINARMGAGVYTFRIRNEDDTPGAPVNPARLYLDGVRIIDAWQPGDPREAQTYLDAGRGYQLFIEADHNGDPHGMVLEWRGPDMATWEPVPARQSSTINYCDTHLQWSAPSLRVDGSEFDPDTQLEKFVLYHRPCGSTAPPAWFGDIPPEFRSGSKEQAIAPGSCIEYLITAVDLDGLESDTDSIEKSCPGGPAYPPMKPIFSHE